ncbi:hypothetical protein H4Q26_003938 [Puccinia striiformis f. sp. tritici PST-130]|uniref:Uncharacterized protein n=2 Tax=Puccinia striiformis TaxID=27350 RepID=A0A0L0V9Z5_9BASI|nr:hypothetical protein H4Q26_003938 [Puccinia striiformis f. sp. tritici PST-130]KNE96108.1 hypothetical protein PSTG_10530 [Puccinia striiformis f. sp. tritici PST-78]POW02013.1 hypothetical protein PSTT_12098 [Puccinia striiformis]
MSKSPKLPLLTDKNFLEWKFKVSAVLDGLGLLKILNGGKPWDANGKFIAIDPNVKTSAMALLAPLVHSSLLSYPYLDFICLYSPGAPQHSLVTTVVVILQSPSDNQ